MTSPAPFKRTLLTSLRAVRLVPSSTTLATRHYLNRPVSRTAPVTPTFTSRTTSRSFQTTTYKMAEEAGVKPLVTKGEWDAALAVKDSVLVLDCFATWCGPCKVIAPQVEKFSGIYKDARFFKLDVDEVPDVAQELGIRAMPTFLLFKDGEKINEVVGANPKALEAAIKEAVETKE